MTVRAEVVVNNVEDAIADNNNTNINNNIDNNADEKIGLLAS